MDLSKFDPLQLNETDFIVDPDAQNVCFFPLPIFTRISEMLSPSDFYNLAQTCRYMHWRMLKYGHLMLKHHNIQLTTYGNIEINEVVTIEGKPSKDGEIIVPRPYVYFEYLHLEFRFYHYSPSMFDKVIDYVIKAKKRTKHYCIKIVNQLVCTQQIFPDINNLIERMKPFHLQLFLSWNDHNLTVEIPNIKNVYSVFLHDWGYPGDKETDFLMNPCATYRVYTIQDLRVIVQEFIKNSRLQFHICDMLCNWMECRVMLEKEWYLKFEEAGETFQNHFCFSQSNDIPLYTSIPSEHGDVEIFIAIGRVVIQRKETYVGQWENFYRNVTWRGD